MPSVTVAKTGEKINCNENANLLRILLDAGVFVDNPCNGTGVCGKCKVKIVAGRVSEMSETERKFISVDEEKDGIRLSCMTEILGDVIVELLQTERKHKVLTQGILPEFEKDTHDRGYGIAVDIGTTTVVTSLIDMRTGKELTSASMINAQKHFGLDVLTRITYEYEHPDTGISELQKAIVDSLNDMIKEVCEKALVDSNEIVEIDVAANCTMMHMLLGVDARSIG
ncbi:MAG: 2Fe-2S iron-sulfur cluster-binding protein, partial [Lachnospiraceae bacterium]